MEGRVLTKETIERFYQHLIIEEKSANTVEKYIRDATQLKYCTVKLFSI